MTSISTGASHVTGLSINAAGLLLHHGQVKNAINIHAAVGDLLVFLSQFKNTVLVGHNVLHFDAHILLHALDKTGNLDKFRETGFIDTLDYFKACRPGMDSYSRENITRVLLHKDYEAHNAVEDVSVLEQLCKDIKLTDMINSSSSVSCLSDKYYFSRSKSSHLATLQPLLQKKVVNNAIARRIARCVLTPLHMKIAHARGGLYSDLFERTFDVKTMQNKSKYG